MPISGKEMLRRYLAKGWILVRQKGSHHILWKKNISVPIPIHGNKDLKKGLEQKLLKILNKDEEV